MISITLSQAAAVLHGELLGQDLTIDVSPPTPAK